MIQTRNTSAILTRLLRRSHITKLAIGTLFLTFVLLLAACGTSAGTALVPPTTSVATTPATSTVQQSATSAHGATTSGYPVKVYFSKFPGSADNNFSAVFPVDRSSPTLGVATFSIQLLIAGPTPSERNAGYFSELNSILSGPSSCSAPYPTGGPDFTLTLNMKGSKASPGTATLKFCRASSSPGVGADARVLAEINATLKQFSNIKNVVVLTQAGNCFGDESGQNLCLK